MAVEPHGRLSTWKEIGAFFGRDERTVKRWEVTRGLPVHRVPGGGRATVYAYVDELALWLQRTEAAEAVSPVQVETPADPGSGPADVTPGVSPTSDRAPGWPRRPLGFVISAGLVALLAVASALWWPRGPAAAPQPEPDDAEAVALYRQGVHDWNTRTPEGLHLAVDEFTQAIVRVPDYARAYVGLADCYNLLRQYTDMPPAVAYPRAKAAALRAIALDPNLAGAHLALAFEQFYWEWRTSVAEREFGRALALDPKSAMTHHWYADFLLHLGQVSAALREIDHAQALDPTDSSILSDRGLILGAAGRQDEALRLLLQMERTNPNYASPHHYLADLYFGRDDMPDYLRETAEMARLMQDPERLGLARAAAQGWRAGGRQGMLRATLQAELRLQTQGRLSPYEVARTYARLGDAADALKDVALAKAGHDPAFLSLAVDSAFTGLHGSRPFQNLLRATL